MPGEEWADLVLDNGEMLGQYYDAAAPDDTFGWGSLYRKMWFSDYSHRPSGTGVLLTGPEGCGKHTAAAHLIRELRNRDYWVGLLPEDKSKKILGINNRIVFAIGNALFFSVFEIFLASTPAFIWVYKWWGALPVFITTYIPFFLASYLIYDAKRATQKTFCGVLWAVDALLMLVLIPLGII